MNISQQVFRDEIAEVLPRLQSYESGTAFLEAKAGELRAKLGREHGALPETGGAVRSPERYSRTTITAFQTNDGAVVAADSRATWGDFKPAIGSFTKLVPLLNMASFGFSGSAAAGQFMALLVEEDFEMYANFHETPMSPRSMANRVNVYSSYFPWCTPIFAVWDGSENRARLFEYGGGSIVEIFTGYTGVGSGSSAIQTSAERVARVVRDLPAAEALPLVEHIMIEAVESDSFTGGDFLFHIITGGGIREIRAREQFWQLRRWFGRIADDFTRRAMTDAEQIVFARTLQQMGEILQRPVDAEKQQRGDAEPKGGESKPTGGGGSHDQQG